MVNPIVLTQQLGQSIWSDYIRRGLFHSGELQKMIDTGITGITSNPTIFERAIVGSTDYDEALLSLSHDSLSPNDVYEKLAIEDIRLAADMLHEIYDHSVGKDGYVSLEVSPKLSHDTEGTIEEARRLFTLLNRPNVMIKVPATPEGIPAFQQLIAEGINVNVTLIFSLAVYNNVREAYLQGLETLVGNGYNASHVASVASFFLSRIDSAVDTMLEAKIHRDNRNIKDLKGKTAIASAKLAYRDFQQTFQGSRWETLVSKGAHVQRPLWASTGTKNPAYSDVIYVESLIGPNTVNTIPPATMNAFLDHGHAESTLGISIEKAKVTLSSLKEAGIDLEQVTDTLLADGIKDFSDSFDRLLAGIKEKQSQLLAPKHVHPGVAIGNYMADVEDTLSELDKDKTIARVWQKDYTVWKSNPTEISNRLAWLNVTEQVSDQLPSLKALTEDVQDAGFRYMVLAGMGGSSLGPEVLRQTFGSATGHPELIVLEAGACLVPAEVQKVNDSIEPLDTLFLISSKSGGTIEPLSLFDYFLDIVTTSAGIEKGAENFIAITDPGSPLAETAEKAGFAHAYLNPPDIGGRYSVLSNFGMVPAALMGIDIGTLLESK